LLHDGAFIGQNGGQITLQLNSQVLDVPPGIGTGGIKIQTVPEPPTRILLVSGLMIMVRLRRCEGRFQIDT
jgi:hypothetical protein